MAREVPEDREDREARQAYRNGALSGPGMMAAQRPGTKRTIGGKTYLKTIDGVHVLTSLPLTSLERRQTHREPRARTKWDQIVLRAQAKGFDPGEVIEPIQAEPLPSGKNLVKDGHHRIDALERVGSKSVRAWVPVKLKRGKVRKAALEGHGPIGQLAQEYAKAHGLPHDPSPLDYVKVDPGQAKAVADYYERTPHDPKSPEVSKAYQAFKRETLNQFNFLQSKGVRLLPWQQSGQPYKNSGEMVDDVRKNNQLHFFAGGDMPADHPLAERTGVKVDGHALTYNDAFRAVHDFFGHAHHGNQFGPRGEEHAYRVHSRMYSPEARPAMAFETKGQNSWVNFGPHGKHNRAHPEDTRFAEQKANVLKFRRVRKAAHTFTSPNVGVLSLDKALEFLGSEAHQNYRRVATAALEHLGLKAQTEDALGAWTDGAENALAHRFEEDPGEEKTNRFASLLGLLKDQKSVLAFRESSDGPDRLHQIYLPDHDPRSAHKRLIELGIDFHTIIPGRSGVTAITYDKGGSQAPLIATAARTLNAQVRSTAGRGDFLGSDAEYPDSPEGDRAHREASRSVFRGNLRPGDTESSVPAGKAVDTAGRPRG